MNGKQAKALRREMEVVMGTKKPRTLDERGGLRAHPTVEGALTFVQASNSWTNLYRWVKRHYLRRR